jgi:peroxiredoxin
MTTRRIRVALGLALSLTIPACGGGEPTPAKPSMAYAYGPPPDQIKFKDDATSNAQPAPASLELTLVDSQGKPVDLKNYRGQRNIVLVFTRGFPGYVCPYCTTQTSRLIANYPEFTRRDAEVLVVFPGPKKKLADFVQAVQAQTSQAALPFPLLLDEDFGIVEKLGIRADMAKPSTYIIDKQGQVRFAYIGATSSDRPSVKALLAQLDQASKG